MGGPSVTASSPRPQHGWRDAPHCMGHWLTINSMLPNESTAKIITIWQPITQLWRVDHGDLRDTTASWIVHYRLRKPFGLTPFQLLVNYMHSCVCMKLSKWRLEHQSHACSPPLASLEHTEKQHPMPGPAHGLNRWERGRRGGGGRVEAKRGRGGGKEEKEKRISEEQVEGRRCWGGVRWGVEERKRRMKEEESQPVIPKVLTKPLPQKIQKIFWSKKRFLLSSANVYMLLC